MKEIFGRFFAIFLICLLLVKVSAFHIYEHHNAPDDSNKQCELCILTIDGQQFEGIVPLPSVIECPSLTLHSRSTTFSFGESHANTFYKGTLYSRPPPYKLA